MWRQEKGWMSERERGGHGHYMPCPAHLSICGLLNSVTSQLWPSYWAAELVCGRAQRCAHSHSQSLPLP